MNRPTRGVLMDRLLAIAALAASLVPLVAAERSSPETLAALTAKYCTACHLPPPPEAITRKHWPQFFGLMEGWIREKGLPFDAAEYTRLLELYRENSPESFPPPVPPAEPGSLAFTPMTAGRGATVARPKITHIEITDLDGDGLDDALVCDDISSRIYLLRYMEGAWREEELAQIAAPVRTRVVDYNGDDLPDIVVASLGFLTPTENPVGSVWILVNRGNLSFEPRPLLQDVSRVADVAPGDYNGDGKIDFVVACFGWRTSGELLLLEQAGPDLFVRHDILERNGAMQVEPTDLNGDGKLDFVVLFSQEHESLEWFRNDGKGRFEWRPLARAPHPAFGSSGFALADLDGDGDTDLIHTNGDMMDEVPLAKPYHGVRWVENTGGAFRTHEIFAMPGCYRAVPRDLDRDGDLDLLVSNIYFDWPVHEFPSLVWLENVGSVQFRPHPIAHIPSNIAALAVADLNHDGVLDILTGGYHAPGPTGRTARLTAFLGTRPAQD